MIFPILPLYPFLILRILQVILLHLQPGSTDLGELLPLATAGGNGLMPKNQFEPILENTDSRGTWISIASLKTTGATGQSACTITLLLSGDNDYTTNQQDVAIVGLSSRPKLSCSISVLSGSKPIIGYTTDGGLHTIWMRRYHGGLF